MTRPRVGVLSTADHHFAGYADLLAGMDGVEFAGVAADDEERGRRAAREHDTTYRPPEELLRAADAVLLFSRYADRAAWFDRAAEAGVDVLCEKPLATGVADARRIVDRWASMDATLGMLMPFRFSEPFERARTAVADGLVGDLQFVVGRNRCSFRERDERGWTTDPDATDGGGSATHHSEHVVDLVRWLTGAEFAEVHAELGYVRDLDVEDVNVVSAELTDGTGVTLDTSWTTPDSDEFWGDGGVELVGTEGRISVDAYGEAVRVVRDGGADPGVEKRFVGADQRERLVRDFLDCVESGGDPRATGRDGLRQVEVLDAIYRSADADAPVAVRRE